MSKYNLKTLWEERYGNQADVRDYAGYLMKKSAIGDPNSQYQPTIDHIRPLSKDGKDIKENIVICNQATNQQKGNTFNIWKVDGSTYRAERVKGNRFAYKIIKEK